MKLICPLFVMQLQMHGEYSFNKHDVAPSCSQKHLVSLLLDEGLKFSKDIQSKMNTCHKVVGVIKKLSSDLPRGVLLRILVISSTATLTKIIQKLGVFNTKHV